MNGKWTMPPFPLIGVLIIAFTLAPYSGGAIAATGETEASPDRVHRPRDGSVPVWQSDDGRVKIMVRPPSAESLTVPQPAPQPMDSSVPWRSKPPPVPIVDPAFYAVGHLFMSEYDELCAVFDVKNFNKKNPRAGKGLDRLRFPKWELSNLTWNGGDPAYWAPWDAHNTGEERMVAGAVSEEGWSVPGQSIVLTSIPAQDAKNETLFPRSLASKKGSINPFLRNWVPSSLETRINGSAKIFWLDKVEKKYGVPMRGPRRGGDINILSPSMTTYLFASPFSFDGRNYFVMRGHRDDDFEATVVGVVFEYRADGGRDDLCYYATVSKTVLDRKAKEGGRK